MPNRKPLSREKYLQGLGLFTLGRNWEKKAEEAAKALSAILEQKDSESCGLGGHTSDAIFGGDDTSFDDLVRKTGWEAVKDGL